ncbi:hypothetical protein EHP00_1387 [Ecytonucleospora hepatopenaei]|uniref:Uncharacterized protein n=1 Tax=Ecytonucleospora hepatopenaei TaxID=646526 RepID=A0A1W0E926_9MICR|nr:hypothetical protein EHP00_1387 [Ecytonucleospora hepatopenaei]
MPVYLPLKEFLEKFKKLDHIKHTYVVIDYSLIQKYVTFLIKNKNKKQLNTFKELKLILLIGLEDFNQDFFKEGNVELKNYKNADLDKKIDKLEGNTGKSEKNISFEEHVLKIINLFYYVIIINPEEILKVPNTNKNIYLESKFITIKREIENICENAIFVLEKENETLKWQLLIYKTDKLFVKIKEIDNIIFYSRWL